MDFGKLRFPGPAIRNQSVTRNPNTCAGVCLGIRLMSCSSPGSVFADDFTRPVVQKIDNRLFVKGTASFPTKSLGY